MNRLNLLNSSMALTGNSLFASTCKVTVTSPSVAGRAFKTQVTKRRKLGGTLEVSSIGFSAQNMSRTYQSTIPSRPHMIKII